MLQRFMKNHLFSAQNMTSDGLTMMFRLTGNMKYLARNDIFVIGRLKKENIIALFSGEKHNI
jgi:hypothetical protein